MPNFFPVPCEQGNTEGLDPGINQVLPVGRSEQNQFANLFWRHNALANQRQKATRFQSGAIFRHFVGDDRHVYLPVQVPVAAFYSPVSISTNLEKRGSMPRVSIPIGL